MLGGSWVVISSVTILISHIRGLITPLITSHEPPSGVLDISCCGFMGFLGVWGVGLYLHVLAVSGCRLLGFRWVWEYARPMGSRD